MKQNKKKSWSLKNAGKRYKNFITGKISTRFHMSLILASVTLTGILFSKLLLELGMHDLLWRYALTVILCYIFFILYIKLWLLYINPGKNSPKNDSNSSSGIDLDLSTGSDTAVESASEAGEMIGQGGKVGGAGASGGWQPAAMGFNTSPVNSDTGGGGSGFSLDIGDVDGDALGPILIVIAVGILVIAIFGSAIFLIYQAPAILSEAAFEAMLASGLFKTTKEIGAGNWIGSIIKRTWIPFAVILILSAATGWTINTFCPGAFKLMDAVNSCVF